MNPFPVDAEVITPAELEVEFKCPVKLVQWLPAAMAFYELPGDVNVNTTNAFISGRVYGMDSSSGAAVAALDPHPGENVLDLCCAPGMKLSLLADTMKRRGTLTGVDVSKVEHFLAVTGTNSRKIVLFVLHRRDWRRAAPF